MYKNLSHLALTTCAILVTACGGGGGGSDDNTGSTNNTVSFSGVTTQASITEENAPDIIEPSLSTGTAAPGPAGVLGITTEGSSTALPPHTLNGLLKHIATEYINTQGPSSLIGAEANPIPCSGGGSITVNTNTNEITGDFTGTAELDNCVEDGQTINGTMTVSGSIDVNTEEFDSAITLTFTNLNTTDGGDVDITMNGTIVCTFSETPLQLSCTENFDVRNNITAETYRTEDFTVTSSEATGGENTEISGRFYHPEHGYVEIVTDEAIYTAAGDMWPSSGTIRLLGADDTSAQIEFTGAAQYTLSVDSDGDGDYDSITTENLSS